MSEEKENFETRVDNYLASEAGSKERLRLIETFTSEDASNAEGVLNHLETEDPFQIAAVVDAVAFVVKSSIVGEVGIFQQRILVL